MRTVEQILADYDARQESRRRLRRAVSAVGVVGSACCAIAFGSRGDLWWMTLFGLFIVGHALNWLRDPPATPAPSPSEGKR